VLLPPGGVKHTRESATGGDLSYGGP